MEIMKYYKMSMMLAIISVLIVLLLAATWTGNVLGWMAIVANVFAMIVNLRNYFYFKSRNS